MLLLITTPDSVVKCYNMQTARFSAFVNSSQEGHKEHIYILAGSGKRKSRPVPKWATHVLRSMLLLLIVIVALLLSSYKAPVGPALGLALGFGLAGVAVMVFISRWRGQMVHCTVFCPIGLISNLIGRISPWQLRIDSGCSKCGKCSRACPYSALKAEDLEKGKPGLTCTLCGDCGGSVAGLIIFSIYLMFTKTMQKRFE
jgi:polyferredoxin